MAKCVAIQRKKKRTCIGARNKWITIQARAIQPPCDDGVDYSEEFTKKVRVKALVETTEGVRGGETIFDDTNTETVVTHKFNIRFITGVTSESWVLMDGIKYRILGVQNVDESNKYIIIKATKRGKESVTANFA